MHKAGHHQTGAAQSMPLQSASMPLMTGLMVMIICFVLMSLTDLSLALLSSHACINVLSSALVPWLSWDQGCPRPLGKPQHAFWRGPTRPNFAIDLLPALTKNSAAGYFIN